MIRLLDVLNSRCDDDGPRLTAYPYNSFNNDAIEGAVNDLIRHHVQIVEQDLCNGEVTCDGRDGRGMTLLQAKKAEETEVEWYNYRTQGSDVCKDQA